MLPGVRTFAGSPSNVASARDFVAGYLTDNDCPGIAEDARLLVSELFTNAIGHGKARAVRVTITTHRDQVRIAITGVGPSPTTTPHLTHPHADAECGRGMEIVDHLAADWGYATTPGATTAWFYLKAS